MKMKRRVRRRIVEFVLFFPWVLLAAGTALAQSDTTYEVRLRDLSPPDGGVITDRQPVIRGEAYVDPPDIVDGVSETLGHGMTIDSLTVFVDQCGGFGPGNPAFTGVEFKDDKGHVVRYQFRIDLEAAGCELRLDDNILVDVSGGTIQYIWPLPPILGLYSETYTFRVEEPPYVFRINTISPTSGGPGTQVELRGLGFREDSEVLFGGRAVDTTSIDLPPFTYLRFTVPGRILCGTYGVQVRNPDGRLSNTVDFTVPCQLLPPAPPPSPPPGGPYVNMEIAMQASPDPVTVSELLTYTVELTNRGPDSASGVQLTLAFDRPVEFVASQPGICMELLSGPEDLLCQIGAMNVGTQTVTIQVRPLQYGTLIAEAKVTFNESNPSPYDDSVSVETQVEPAQAPPPPGNPFYDVVSLNLPETAQAGMPFSGEVTIRNTGDAGGTAPVQILVNGSVQDGADVQFDAGQTRTLPLTLTFANPGTYTVEVRTPHDSLSQTVNVQGPGTQPPPPPPPPGSVVNVGIQNFAFNPQTITVPVGTTVVWTNLDTVPHTVTSTDGLFNSGTLAQGQTFQYTFNTPGTYSYSCTIHPSMTATVVVQSSQPPPSGGNPLKQFDTNNNNVIDDPEFFAIIDAWIAGEIGDSLFFQAVDLWVSQAPIASAGLRSRPRAPGAFELSVHSGSHTTTFRVQGLEVTSMAVRVYDLMGREIFAQETTGHRVVWDQSGRDGRVAANGVYLYVVTVRGLSGSTIRSDVKKLVILR